MTTFFIAFYESYLSTNGGEGEEIVRDVVVVLVGGVGLRGGDD